MVRFHTIRSEFCHFNGPFLRLWHHQIHIRIDRLCRCLSGEAITPKGRGISFPESHFSLLRQRARGAASPTPFPRYPTSGAGESRAMVGTGNRERNPLRRRRLTGIPASLLLCCCYHRVATAAVSDSLRTTSDSVGAGTALPAVCRVGVTRSSQPGSPRLFRGDCPWSFPRELCSVLLPLSAPIPQGHGTLTDTLGVVAELVPLVLKHSPRQPHALHQRARWKERDFQECGEGDLPLQS